MNGCAATQGERAGVAAQRGGSGSWGAAVLGVLVAATGIAPSADALAQRGNAVPATRDHPNVQPDWSALPGQNATTPARAFAPASLTTPAGPASEAPARPAAARVLRAAEALQASGFGGGAIASAPARRVVAGATLEAQGGGSFAPIQRVTAPAALEAFGLSSPTDRTVQRAVLPLR